MRQKTTITVTILVAGLLTATSAMRAAERRPDAGVPGVARHCPGTAKMLMGTSTFSTLAGTVGCVTPQAEAFLVLYRAQDLDGFRTLARASTAGSKLYALCGLKHLHAEEEAKELRRELSVSQGAARTSPGGAMKPVSELVTAKNGKQISEFDIVCDYLVEKGMQPHRSACDTEGVRPKCE